MDQRLVDGLGLWLERLSDVVQPGRPALLLDRDGVIVRDTHYLGRADDVRMLPGAASVIKWANGANVPVVIVTNQAGIGRGYYDWHGFEAVQHVILQDLARAGAHVDLVLACAFHRDGRGPFAAAAHPWRKPNPGMIFAAQEALALDLSASLVVGDKISDLEAGRKAGVGLGVLVETGHGRSEVLKLQASSLLPMKVMTARDICDARDRARATGWPGQIAG